MLTTIYLAGRFSRRPELNDYAARLRELGFTVQSRWLADPEHRVVESGELTPEQLAHNQALIQNDLSDIACSDWVVYFAPAGSRGGCNVEFGYALAQGKRLFWIGARSHVFSYIAGMKTFVDAAAFLSWADGYAERQKR